MAATPLALKLTGISKTFRGVSALEDVTLEVAAGGVHGILGENGAGKTTLMNIIAGLLRPDSGRVEVMGDPVPLGSVRAGRAQGIGMVHQHFKLVENQSVLDNLVLAVGKSLFSRTCQSRDGQGQFVHFRRRQSRGGFIQNKNFTTAAKCFNNLDALLTPHCQAPNGHIKIQRPV